MKIAYVIPMLDICGGIRMVFEHCNRLSARLNDVTLISQRSTNRPAWFDLRPDVRILPETCCEPFDVMVVTGAVTHDYVHNYQNAKRKFYFVQMRESLFSPDNGAWYRRVEATYADRTIRPFTISRWGKEFLETEYGWKDVPLIGNGVTREFWFPNPKPNTCSNLILTEGRQDHYCKDEKGYTWEAAMTLRDRHPGLRIAGYSADKHKYAKHFDVWLEHPQQHQMTWLYQNSRFLIKASRFDFLGGAPVEAMACGVPTVRALVREDDYLIDGYNSLRCGYDEPQKFMANCERLLADQDLYKHLVWGCLDFSKRCLNWDDKIDELEKLYAG